MLTLIRGLSKTARLEVARINRGLVEANQGVGHGRGSSWEKSDGETKVGAVMYRVMVMWRV